MSNKIGRFEIQAEISRSSAGSVSKACDPTGGQIVALKTVDLKPFGDKAAAVVKRVLEEAESSKLLNTHNIAMLFGAGEIEGQFCATMEYVQGNSIEPMLARKEVFSIWDVQDIARQSCQGFDHARVNKVLHYSLEPAKVMVQWDGIVKTLGFGVSMMGVFAAEICTETPKILHYMSPEQIQGLPIDFSSNLFSLGAILYEMVTQIKAFDGDDAEQVRQSVLEIMPAPPCDINPKIDPALSDVIMKALSKAPADRYQSGQELINDLERCKNSPAKSAPDNKTSQAVAAVKTPQIKIPPQMEKKMAAPAAVPTAAGRAMATAKPQPSPNPKTNASGAAAGAGPAPQVSATPSPLKAAKVDASPQFISTCVKASIDAVTQGEAKMSTATVETQVEAPKIKIDPMMDESLKETSASSRSFSEIDELPPLKEVYVAPPPPPAYEPTPHGAVHAAVFKTAPPEKPKVQPSEVAKKAVAEIRKTPPKIFMVSIAGAIGIIVLIVAAIAWHIHSENADEDATPNQPASASAQPKGSATPSAAQSPAATPTPAQVAPEQVTAETRAVSVQPKYNKKKAKPRPAAPAIIPGQLSVSSTPAGAQIQIDGQNNSGWVTPLNLAGLNPGQHTLTISKPGYASETRNIDVGSGSKSFISVQLAPLTGTVAVTSDPAGVAVWMDGKDTGRVTPAQISVDKPGNHSFIFKKQGYLDETTTANLQIGQTFRLSPSLRPLANADNVKIGGKFKKLFGNSDTAGMGAVNIKTQPKGAQIAINNRIVEKNSPVEFYLDPGNYVLDITMSGFKSIHRVITVEKNGKVAIDESLDRE